MSQVMVSSGMTVSGNAKIINCAEVSNSARVFDHAIISMDAKISDCAIVCGNATVRGQAKVRGYAEVSGNALVCSYATVDDHAIITDSAMIGNGCSISEYAFIGGHVRLENVTVKGFVKLDLPITIDRVLTLSKPEDFVSVILEGKTYVYVKPVETWFPLPPETVKEQIEKL